MLDDSVCRVGYALNAKKMRRGGYDSVHKGWKGGGLAEILEEPVEGGVSFQSINFDISAKEQVIPINIYIFV